MSQDEIVACAKCGGKNRIPASAVGTTAKARCGHCGAELSIPTPADEADIRAAIIEPQAPKRKRGRFRLGFVLGAIVAAVLLFLVDRQANIRTLEIAGLSPSHWLDQYWPAAYDDETPPPEADGALAPELSVEPEIAPAEPEAMPAEAAAEPGAPPPAPALEPAPPAPAAPLVAEAVTPGILYDYTGNEALAPLTVVTSPGEDYYVKLVYEGTNTAAIGIYVQGGVSNEVSIPLGRYEMRYASGTTWYGLTDLFGPETAYAKTLDVLDFHEEDGEYKGYTIELILQENGNLDTEALGPGDF